MARRQSCEGEQPIAGFLQAIGDGAVLEPPLADEGLAAGFNLLARGGVDHVGVVGGDLLVQALGGVREEIAMLVNRAALDRHAVPDDGDGLVEPRRAVDDEELGPSQTALDEIVEDGAPGLGALAAHALDREQHLLAVLAYAKDDKERDRSRFAVEPRAHHCAVDNEPARSVLRQASGRSTPPSRSSPCARPCSPYPCRPRRQKGRRVRGAPGVC